jgi:hypothetical protein
MGAAGCHKCEGGTVRACYSGPPATVGVGTCRAGEQVCLADSSDWGPCEGEVKPAAAESCGTGVDATCDGQLAPACAPQQLTATNDPEFMSIDADHVYWTSRSSSTVSRIPKDGSSPATVLYMNEVDPRGIDASGATLLWTVNDGLRSGAKDGSGAAAYRMKLPLMALAACNDLFFMSVVADGPLAFVTTGDNEPCPPVIAVDAMGQVAHAYHVVDGSLLGTGVAADGGQLFATHELYRLDASGANQPIQLDDDFSAEGLAVDDDWVYVKASAKVFKVSRDGGGRTMLAPIPRDCGGTEYYPTNIALRGSWVYFIDNCEGEVRRVNKDGTGLHTVARATYQPFAIAADEHAIYWTETQLLPPAGRVMRLEQP